MIVRFPTTEIQTQQTDKNKSFHRGIYIPEEIRCEKNLNRTERDALTKIRNLQDPHFGGCFASNAYLAEFLNVSERYVQKIIYKLKNLGFLESLSCKGKKRVLRIISVGNCSPSTRTKYRDQHEQYGVHTKETKAFFQKAKETTTTDSKPKASRGVDPKVSSSSPYQEMKTKAAPKTKAQIDPVPELEHLPLKDVTKRNIYRDFSKEQILAGIPAVSEAKEEGKVESLDRFAYAAVRDGYKPKNSHKSSNIKYFEEKKKLHADFVIMNRNEKTVQIDLGGNTPREISLSDPDFKQKLDESLHYLAPKPNLEGKPTLHTPMIGAIGNIDYNITMQKSFVQNMAQTPFSGPQIQHNIHSQNQEQVKNCTLFQSPIQKSTIPKLKEEIPESEELIKNRQEAKSLIEQNRELLSQKGIRLQARAKCILIERIDHRDIGINTRPIEYDAPDFKNRIDSLFGDASISHSSGPPFA